MKDIRLTTLIYFMSHIHRRHVSKMKYMRTNYSRTKEMIEICQKQGFLVIHRETETYFLTSIGLEFLRNIREFVEE